MRPIGQATVRNQEGDHPVAKILQRIRERGLAAVDSNWRDSTELVGLDGVHELPLLVWKPQTQCASLANQLRQNQLEAHGFRRVIMKVGETAVQVDHSPPKRRLSLLPSIARAA